MTVVPPVPELVRSTVAAVSMSPATVFVPIPVPALRITVPPVTLAVSAPVLSVMVPVVAVTLTVLEVVAI